ncbi:uncharacterized protein BXZ73DRAFT_77042 [Epithele typhae]|uniref:uncharacterized protein n=1 Tax=Epithele typhae TaxID=378194 RepID=UPI0020089491|nr:uncharacterized protein BXZ73DRAFT_77042 [Epithele typhae]KAH9934571.1 hypothetical protein BXZ73DRAFT_77042 [Epithele typhae]
MPGSVAQSGVKRRRHTPPAAVSPPFFGPGATAVLSALKEAILPVDDSDDYADVPSKRARTSPDSPALKDRRALPPLPADRVTIKKEDGEDEEGIDSYERSVLQKYPIWPIQTASPNDIPSEDKALHCSMLHGWLDPEDDLELTTDGFVMLTKALRLQTKYGFEGRRYRERIMRRISSVWPTTLGKHDKNSFEQKRDIVSPTKVIALLRECGESDPAILAPLFYAAAKMYATADKPDLVPLSREDQERLQTGVARLRIVHNQHVGVPLGFLHGSVFEILQGCSLRLTHAVLTRWRLQDQVEHTSNPAPRMRHEFRPVEAWREGYWAIWRDVYAGDPSIGCLECGDLLGCEVQKQRQRLWDHMPAFFGLV